jgi:hypothetical protein
MQDPFILFKTSALAEALEPLVAPDGDARSSTKA